MFRAFCFAAVIAGAFVFAAPALACSSGPDGFPGWLANFRRAATAEGISAGTLSSALNSVTYDPLVIRKDRSQHVFRQSFAQFSGRMVPPRLGRGSAMLKSYGGALRRIEDRFGVPGSVVVAIWGLETDFGAGSGNFSTIRSLATLAYDCRRSALFSGELLAALRIVERGDMVPDAMHGGWAGELGQTQFLPSSYVKFAVDFDGDGRRDLIGSPVDVLASTANFLKGHGWRAGQPWSEGTANFAVLRQWNKSEVYSQTVAYFATRLAE